jgi:hypothetical protein
MFMNGVFDSTYGIRCILCKTSIMMMQYLSYLVVCNVTHPRRCFRRHYLPPFHVSASRPSTGFATAQSSQKNCHQRLQYCLRRRHLRWDRPILYFTMSLAQPSYLEAWVCLAIRDYCLAQHIKSAYSCLGPTFVFGMFVNRGVCFRSPSVLGEDSQVPHLKGHLFG